MSKRVLTSCLLAFAAVSTTSIASAAGGKGMSWHFQSTGYHASQQATALAMRDGLTWPVIFAPIVTGDDNGGVSAISIYPVINDETGTFWHVIGENLMPIGTHPPNCVRLRAASSITGEFAAVSRISGTCSYAVTGSSLSGFEYLGDDIYGVDYDSDGNLFTLTKSTLPLPFSAQLFDIDSSMPGTIGVITFEESCYQYHQTSPLLGGWYSYAFPQEVAYLWPDLALDAYGRPHIASTGNDQSAIVSDFNIMSGEWTTTILDDGYASSPIFDDGYASSPVIAADSRGGVGAAWVGSDGALKYAYKIGNASWTTHVVANGVLGPDYQVWAVDATQIPGLVFDANDFPVISFTADYGEICLAYDPSIDVPEPSTICLLAVGLLAAAWLRLRKS